MYQLNPAQKAILETAGENINFDGDDNDFSCLLSRISLNLFMSGNIAASSGCYQNDPMACYGTTFSSWESVMKTMVMRHLENERAMNAHSAFV